MRHILSAALAVMATQACAVTVAPPELGGTTTVYDEAIDGELSDTDFGLPLATLQVGDTLIVRGSLSGPDDRDLFRFGQPYLEVLARYDGGLGVPLTLKSDGTSGFRIAIGSRYATDVVTAMDYELSFYSLPMPPPRTDPNAIPLPAGAWLLLAGLGALGLTRRKA